MRILLVTPYYVPAWSFGGPVQVVADLARALRQRGHSITIATTDVWEARKRIDRSTDIIDNIPVHYFSNLSALAAFRWNLYLPKGFQTWLLAHIHEFDLIHCHDFYTGLNFIVSQVAGRAGVPYVIQPHGALIPVRVGAKFSALKRLWLFFFQRVLRNSSCVIASTEQERQEIIQYQHLSPDKVVTIPNGLDPAEVFCRGNNPRERQRLGIAEHEYIILYFGRIQYIKGLDISLSALARVTEVPWKFVIVGRDDGEQASLEKLCGNLGMAERVLFVGPKFGPELDALLGISDVFLFNSRSESFSMAVLKACAAGLPVVLSPECRVPEIASWGAGIVMGVNSTEETFESLRSLLPDKTRRSAMGHAGQVLVAELFTLGRVVDKLSGLYQDVLTRVLSKNNDHGILK